MTDIHSDIQPEQESGSEHTKIKTISKKKIIYLEIDDEITSVYDRVRNLPNKIVYVMVPRRAILFQSVVNLKILKSKMEEIGKELAIITQDPVGLKLTIQAGIKAFDQLEADIVKMPKKMLSERSEPIEASSNELSQENPTRVKNMKISIVDIVTKSKEAASQGMKLILPFTKISSKLNPIASTKITLVTPSKRAYSTLIVASVGLFMLIAYFALPGATVTLTTSPNVLQRSINITLADASRNSAELKDESKKLIATYPISITVTKEITYNSTGEYFEGSNSTGKINVINKSGNNWPLIANTRFQTADGLVYRIKQFVTVPASKQIEKTRPDGSTYTDTVPGEIEVYVVADTEDAFGKIIGDRGNVPPSKFFIPGLSKTSQNLIYAESKVAFTGGKTVSKPRVTEEDINASRQKLLEALKAQAITDLREKVEADNSMKNTNLRLMDDSFTIEFSEPTYIIPEGIIAQELTEFKISGQITATGIAYNHNEVMNILKQELQLHKSPEKILVYIYDKSFTYDIVDIDTKTQKIKITASIKAIEEFDINPDSENGRRLAKKIKEHIIGKKKKDAISYIQNLPEVNKVEVKTWPSWAPTLPSIPDNIKIKVIQGSPAEPLPES